MFSSMFQCIIYFHKLCRKVVFDYRIIFMIIKFGFNPFKFRQRRNFKTTNETNLSLILLSIVAVFLFCHFPRLILNMAEFIGNDMMDESGENLIKQVIVPKIRLKMTNKIFNVGAEGRWNHHCGSSVSRGQQLQKVYLLFVYLLQIQPFVTDVQWFC